jgi:hypothetical protein
MGTGHHHPARTATVAVVVAGLTGCTTSGNTDVGSSGSSGVGATAKAVCAAVPSDAAKVVMWGRQYDTGAESAATLRTQLAGLEQQWTAYRAAAPPRESGLADRMVSLLQTTEFAAVHDVPGGSDHAAGDGRGMVVAAREWTGGDLAYDYRQACGKELPAK